MPLLNTPRDLKKLQELPIAQLLALSSDPRGLRELESRLGLLGANPWQISPLF